MRVYQLLNKNRLIGSFTVDGSNEMEFISSVNIDKDKMPPWVSNFEHFIEKRRAPLHREHIKRLLDTCGCNTLTGFFRCFTCIKFKKHSRYNLPEWRLESLNKAVNNQIEKILS